ncbi:thioredoxin reductase [Weissella oryzae SG25]|uniref:Thioredoxin reductase n=1 Tax=Weissella oryzae (strain DSM 25784 / JCM 18191 / LMG 30913 / SG25) TaxID=1329250 RepID=A0A069CSP9_WEIOS|nr:hypothetical protein [Weissella oryzae]GAK30820.1 thioredoxin reductase [Weissella oryzae SG25]
MAKIYPPPGLTIFACPISAGWVLDDVTAVAENLNATLELAVGVLNIFTIIPMDCKGSSIGKG